MPSPARRLVVGALVSVLVLAACSAPPTDPVPTSPAPSTSSAPPSPSIGGAAGFLIGAPGRLPGERLLRTRAGGDVRRGRE